MTWKLLVLLIVATSCSSEESSDASDAPTWRFKCIPEIGCHRLEGPSSSDEDPAVIFTSIHVCRTVCGHYGALWPKPKKTSLGKTTVFIHPANIRYDLSESPNEVLDLLREMTRITNTNLLLECGGEVTRAAEMPVVVYISVQNPDTELALSTNETYTLGVKIEGENVNVYIVANTVFGARHALETFSQLAAPDKLDQCGLRLITEAVIEDSPVYVYRGLLLDTARNFIPFQDVKRMVDGMASTKMNVFHWHITDSQSFPLQSYRVPQLTRYGAYSCHEIYTIDEVKDLIKYAKVRGVRVMIEIDAPAHAGNGWQWGRDHGFGDLAVCVNVMPWRYFCVEPPCGQLNPANNEMYRVLKDLYMDIAEVLPKPPLFHMGGDEVHFGCWNSSLEILSYMKDRGISVDKDGFIRLWAEFHSRALRAWDEAAAAYGAAQDKVVIWSSELTQPNIIERFLSRDRYIIEVWEPLLSPTLMELVQLGYSTISVPKDIWYLDYGLWGNKMYSNWRRMYEHMIPRHPLVLGGETAMWTEYVDISSLDTRIWPRAAAVGERLWSDPQTNVREAERRLLRHRERLAARGLRPDVIGPEWCAQNDAKCV